MKEKGRGTREAGERAADGKLSNRGLEAKEKRHKKVQRWRRKKEEEMKEAASLLLIFLKM